MIDKFISWKFALGYAGSSLTCCGSNGPISRPNCFAIEIPTNDPYYSQFNRTCLNFVRALPTPELDCSLGQRQQLNQNTHYIDGSQIYGSDEQTSNSLRTFTGGLFKAKRLNPICGILAENAFTRPKEMEITFARPRGKKITSTQPKGR